MNDIKLRILTKYPVCECCGINKSTELHHCIVGQKKSQQKAVRDWLHDEVNLQATCTSCNTTHRAANAHENRVKHIKKRVAEGYKVNEWFNQAPSSWYRVSEFRQLALLALKGK